MIHTTIIHRSNNVAVAMILHGGGAIRNTTFNNNYVDIVLAYNTPENYRSKLTRFSR